MGRGVVGLFVPMILVSSRVLADADDYGHGMGGMMFGSYGYGGMFFGWVIGLLFIAVLVLLIIWLVKQIQKK